MSEEQKIHSDTDTCIHLYTRGIMQQTEASDLKDQRFQDLLAIELAGGLITRHRSLYTVDCQ